MCISNAILNTNNTMNFRLFNLGRAYSFYTVCQLFLSSKQCWEQWNEEGSEATSKLSGSKCHANVYWRRDAETARVPGIFILDWEHRIQFHFL